MADKGTYTFANPVLSEARVQDVVAKIARVTLKDTIRVMRALDLVCDFAEDSADIVLEGPFDYGKPTREQAEACSKAYDMLAQAMGSDSVSDIRKVD